MKRPDATPDATPDTTIDLNADVGELPERLLDGSEAALLRCLSSANVACGGHAGDAASMAAVARLCRELRVALGAHPSYPDRAGFGRRRLPMTPDEIADSVAAQVQELAGIAASAGLELTHLKPHGALYHDAADEAVVAEAVTRAAARHDRALVLVGRAGSRGLEIYRAAGFRVAAEAFADRRYEPDGTLRSRDRRGALLTDPDDVAEQALAILRGDSVRTGSGERYALHADTLCLHGDTPGAERLAAELRRRLESAGVRVAALRS